MNGGQYNDVLANDTYFVAVVKRLFYMIFGWWSFGLICMKPNFILYFPYQNIFNHLKTLKRVSENHHILARYVALGSYSTKPE
jgi:hypothetical protein